MRARVALTRFESPLATEWLDEQIARLAASEQTRLASIERSLRREQFIVGHRLLRLLLADSGFGAARIEVDSNRRVAIQADEPLHASMAHSDNTIAVVLANDRIGVDLEVTRTLRDPRAAAALLGIADATDSGVLRAWTISEARMKAGSPERPTWHAVWQGCQLAVVGVSEPPLTGVFEWMGGTYNPIELRWEQVQ